MSYVWLHQVNETQYRYQLPRDNDPSVLHGCQKYCNCRKIHIKQQMQHFKKCTISCWRILLSLSLLFQKLLSSEMFNKCHQKFYSEQFHPQFFQFWSQISRILQCASFFTFCTNVDANLDHDFSFIFFISTLFTIAIPSNTARYIWLCNWNQHFSQTISVGKNSNISEVILDLSLDRIWSPSSVKSDLGTAEK